MTAPPSTHDTARQVSTRMFAGLIVCLCIVMVDGFDLQSIGFVAPEIARAWSVDLSRFGMVFGAGLVGTIPGAMLAGLVARRFGRRTILAMAMATFGAAALASAGAANLAQLAAWRFIEGIGVGAAVPLVMASVADGAPTRWRAGLVTLLLCGQPVGAIVGAALCARLIPDFGWRFAFWLGGTLPFLLLPLLAILPGQDPASARAAGAGGGAAPTAAPPGILSPDYRAVTLLLWASAALAVMLTYLIVNWLPGLLRGAGHSLEASLRAVSLVNAGGIGGALALGAVIDRLGPDRTVAVAYLLGALSLPVVLAPGLPSILIDAACLFTGLAVGGAGMCLGSLTVLLVPPRLRAISAGWTLGIGRLCAALGSLAIGTLMAAGLGGTTLFYIASSMAILAASCVAALGRLERRRRLARAAGEERT